MSSHALAKYSPMLAAFQRTIAGDGEVYICTKGFRPMYDPSHTKSCNFVWFGGMPGSWNVGAVCRQVGADPQLIHDIYFSYDLAGRIIQIKKGDSLDDDLWERRAEIINALLPFPTIVWMREDGGTGEIYEIGRTKKGPLPVPLEHIKCSIAAGKTADEISKRGWAGRRRVRPDDKAVVRSIRRHLQRRLARGAA